jgi:hypothetical protein
MKGPKGSVFEPAEYKIDAKKGDNCDDIAFKLKGFSLKFSVKAKNQEDQILDGPEGLTVELRRASKKGSSPMAMEITDASGAITFKDITVPDVYEVRISSNDDLTFKQPEIACDFKWESGFKCEHDYFLITGFSISGTVLSYNDPMPNVNVYLHPIDAAITDKSKNALQQSETNPQGIYKFTNVPLGRYQVVASYNEN